MQAIYQLVLYVVTEKVLLESPNGLNTAILRMHFEYVEIACLAKY